MHTFMHVGFVCLKEGLDGKGNGVVDGAPVSVRIMLNVLVLVYSLVLRC
jgi:hypothetical protein